jgi:hypothetical protein
MKLCIIKYSERLFLSLYPVNFAWKNVSNISILSHPWKIMGMGMVGFSPGGEKRYMAGIEWLYNNFRCLTKTLIIQCLAHHFFLWPLNLSLHNMEQYPAVSCSNCHYLQNSCLHNIHNHTSLIIVTCIFSQWHEVTTMWAFCYVMCDVKISVSFVGGGL